VDIILEVIEGGGNSGKDSGMCLCHVQVGVVGEPERNDSKYK
jgi:hypothetical protein